MDGGYESDIFIGSVKHVTMLNINYNATPHCSLFINEGSVIGAGVSRDSQKQTPLRIGPMGV